MRWISFAWASLAPARSADHTDARHRGLLEECTRAAPPFRDIIEPTNLAAGRRGRRGGHTQESAHTSAGRQASNMPARRQHPSILVARQLFPGVQDDQKELCGLAGCGMAQHCVETTTRRLDLTTPCQPVQSPNLTACELGWLCQGIFVGCCGG